jgi:hypothetical protein
LKKKRKLNCLDEDLKEVERNQHGDDATLALTQINYTFNFLPVQILVDEARL